MNKPNWMTSVLEAKREPAPKPVEKMVEKAIEKAIDRVPFRPTHEAIANRAYELYEEAGYPAGRDVEFWLAAERELITER